MNWFWVLVAMTALDFVWGRYAAAAAVKDVMALPWAAGITLLSGFVTVSYVKNWRMLMPAVLGALLGTWLAIR